MAQKLMPKLDFPPGWRGGPSPPVITEDLAKLAQRLLHDLEMPARDRVASVLIAVFAQPVSRVAHLTADDVALDGENVATGLATPRSACLSQSPAMSASC